MTTSRRPQGDCSKSRATEYVEYLMRGRQCSGAPLADLVLLGDLIHEEQAVGLLNWLDAQAGKALPIVLFSALPASRLHELTRRIRAVGIVVKPFDADQLIRVVRGAIRSGSGPDAPDTSR